MPSLEEILPDEATQVGSVQIGLFLSAEGVGYAYAYEGISPEAALGYLQVVADRIRDDMRASWGAADDHETSCLGPECPECGYTTDDEDPGDDE